MASIFDTPSIPALRSIIREIQEGQLLIPDFQRPFMWKDEKRLNLFDSIAKGIPIGTLLVWRTHRHQLETYRKLGPFKLPPESERTPRTYLIDGHQRLTTLYAGLVSRSPEPPPMANSKERPLRPIFIDLELDPASRIFVLRSPRDKDRPTLIPVWVLLNRSELFKCQQALWKAELPEKADRLERLANGFVDTTIPLVPMITEDISLVTHGFARINQGGSKMSEAHLVTALAYVQLPELRDRLQAYAEDFENLGWPLVDPDALLDLLKIRFGIDIYRGESKALIDHLGDPLQLESLLSEGRDSLKWAIWMLAQVPCYGSEALPYRYQLLILAEALRSPEIYSLLNDPAQQQAIRTRVTRWFWQTTFTEFFTGATGKTISHEVWVLRSYLSGHLQALPLEGAPVRNVTHHSWGAVRTLARILVSIGEDEERARLLGMMGKRVVHKVLPELDSRNPGAYIVATADELAELRSALNNRTSIPPACARQLPDIEKLALLVGTLGYFQEHCNARLARLEEDKIKEVGLNLERPIQ